MAETEESATAQTGDGTTVNGTATATAADLATRLVILETRLEALKENFDGQKKSFLKRISEWAGLAALLIAIISGIFTFYDKLTVVPEKDRESDLIRLQQIVEHLTKINSDLARLSQSVPPDQLQQIAGIENGTKFMLAQQAANIINRYPKYIDPTSLIVIANEYLQTRDGKSAIRYATLAFDAANNDLMRAAAKRYIADATMIQDSAAARNEAERNYGEAISYARKASGPHGLAEIGNAYRDWIVLEAEKSHCDKLKPLMESLQSEFKGAGMPEGFVVYKSQIANNFKLAKNTKCESEFKELFR